MKKTFSILLITFASLLTPFIASATALSDYAENVIADHVFRGTAYSNTLPANYYIALYTTACSDAAGGTEVAVGSYARVAVARSQTAWNGTQGTAGTASSGTLGTISNALAITFPAATADWGIVTHWGIVDAATLGNLVVCAPLTTARSITNGSTASYAAGALTVQIDN